MRKNDRPSLMVTLLDRDKATELVRNKTNIENVDAQPMVVVNSKKGLATVCIEGVGWTADENGLYTLMYFGNFSENWIDITRDELDSLISDEQTDLATFIRVFGDRLENNFDLWYYACKDLDQNCQTLVVR